MSKVETPHREHKDPKQLIQGGIEGGENTPLRGWKQTLEDRHRGNIEDKQRKRRPKKVIE